LANPLKNQYNIVFVTVASKQEAEKISQNLLEAKLIACANIVGPIASHFQWGGKVERAEEFLVMMKSRSDLFEKLSAAVAKLHSYEVPEILAIPIIAGSKSYLAWLENTLR
jgi:periplasmic divalent cation tolerance protein